MNDKKDIIKIDIRTYKKPKRREYSDIYVNGIRIIRNHLETHAETFLDGTVLGIHGIVTDRWYIRKQPQWIIFNTEQMQPLLLDAMALARNSYSSATIQTIKEIDGQLHLTTDTRAHMSCKKSPDANYKFEIVHTYITGNVRGK